MSTSLLISITRSSTIIGIGENQQLYVLTPYRNAYAPTFSHSIPWWSINRVNYIRQKKYISSLSNLWLLMFFVRHASFFLSPNSCLIHSDSCIANAQPFNGYAAQITRSIIIKWFNVPMPTFSKSFSSRCLHSNERRERTIIMEMLSVRNEKHHTPASADHFQINVLLLNAALEFFASKCSQQNFVSLLFFFSTALRRFDSFTRAHDSKIPRLICV